MSEAAASAWARYVAEVGFSDLPADVVHRMKRSLLDMVGVCLTGSRDESSRLLVSYLAGQAGPGEATIFPSGVRTTAAAAALGNATEVHATELAESFTRAKMHVGNAVVPAALALAEKRRVAGRDLLLAMALGYEIAIRSGLATRVDPASTTFAAKPETRPGYRVFSHPVATFGIYGAAAASAKLLGLDAARARNALTIGTSIAPAIGLQLGIRGFKEGAMSKDLNQGFANFLAVVSTELAAAGVTGPADVTSHFAALSEDFAPELLTRGLGDDYLISSGGLHFKIHCTAGMTQETADAVLEVLGRRPIDPAEVESITMYVNHRGVRMCADPEPPDVIAAKLSIPYVASAVITFYDEVRRDPHFTALYTDAKLADPRRRELARKVQVVGVDAYDEAFEREWPMAIRGRVEVRLRSGEVETADTDVWATTSNLSDQQVIDKFLDLAGRVLDPDRGPRIVDEVFAIDRAASLAGLIDLVVQPAGRSIA